MLLFHITVALTKMSIVEISIIVDNNDKSL